MPCERKPMRYGHSEGHTEVCFDDTGKFMVTCGNDGDVRIWESLDDDDPKFITVGEKAFSLALKNGKLVTAASNNAVQIHTFPHGDPDGILTRFTTNATHVAFNSSGSRVAAGSSDFLVKVVEVSDSSQQKTLRGHEAPVLAVTFDPRDDFLASSSCDGSVVVWNVEDQTQVISWNLLQKTNDVVDAPSLCRLAWQPGDAQMLAVPVENKVHLYQRSSWELLHTLTDQLLTQTLNVVVWSPCGRFLAAGSVGGFLVVWDVTSGLCVERQKHEKGFTVCGLAWSPSGSQIAYTDTEGCLGLLDGLGTPPPDAAAAAKVPVKKAAKDFDALFDDDDDDERVLDEGLSETTSPVTKVVAADDEDDEDFLMPATGRVRNRGAFLDDDNSLDAGSLKLGHDRFVDEDDVSGVTAAAPPLPPRPVYEGPLPTPPQKAFQPGSTPAHLTHRFLVWNSVGIVRGYNDELDNAIDVEFHDSAVHHAMHLSNTLGHALADLSQEAVLLACPSTDQLASKLQCLHFSSWDTNKEWMLDLPPGEDARALCLGRGWAAVATSSLMLRLFSIGGVQREVFSLPGPVVCMAGHGEQLLIVYHRATGFDGEQALGVQLLQLGRRKRRVIGGEPLPLSLKSHLSWLGFTAEGTPCSVDSCGVVRLLNRQLAHSWTPVCDTRETSRSRWDHYWVVGAHENPQQLRCIPCKGSRYPPTLPRPAVAILPFKLPLCQTATEKGNMEEQFLRSVLFHQHHSFLSAAGYQTDQEVQSRSHKEQQELLMKMFALSCKLEREFRCVELAEMMTHSVVTLAIRYASRSRRLALAQRLSELALEKAGQIQEEEEEEEEEEQSYVSRRLTARERRTAASSRQEEEQQEEEQQEEEQQEEEQQEEEQEEEEEEEGAAETKTRLKPFTREDDSPATPPPPPPGGGAGRVNPFKVAGLGKPSSSGVQPRVTNILDNMAANRKSTPLSGSAAKTSRTSKTAKTTVLKPLAPRPKAKTQSTLLQMSVSNKATQKKSQENKEAELRPEAPPPENTENQRPTTGFQLWLLENRKSIAAERPDLQEADVIKEAMGRFRALTAEQRLSFTERAKSQTVDAADLKKRKRETGGGGGGGGRGGGGRGGGGRGGEEEDEEKDPKKKKAADSSSKLSAFAFTKN